MADKQGTEERRRANKVDIGPITYPEDVIAKWRKDIENIYENTVSAASFIPWLKDFILALVEPRPAGYEGIPAAISLPMYMRMVPVADLADTEIPTDRAFDMKVFFGQKLLFIVHFEPQGDLLHVSFRGTDYAGAELYLDMRERLEFAFPYEAHPATQTPTKRSVKSRAYQERNRVKASLIHWACEIGKKVSQDEACKIVNMFERTYLRYRTDDLLYSDAEIATIAEPFAELWERCTIGNGLDDFEFDSELAGKK